MVQKSYGCSARSEHPAHGPTGKVWGDNVERFYKMGTKHLRTPSFTREMQKVLLHFFFLLVGAKVGLKVECTFSA